MTETIHEIPYRYICIEGNIASGKTSLVTRLSKMYSAKMVLEQFTDNPFLPFFYAEPDRYAFPVEIFFLTERHKQLQKQLMQDLFSQHIFGDYAFFKSLLFAKNNLNTEEFRIYQQLYNLLSKGFPEPDLLVYLHRSPEKLLELMEQRGRNFEKQIESNYLENIQNAYFEYFRAETNFPILIIDVENLDFVKNKSHLNEIVQLCTRSYTPGVHRVSLYV